MVVENPFTQPHYLTTYFPVRPTIIDKDRTENGDYYKKPTQFWFVNFQPEQNMFFESLEDVPVHNIAHAEKLGIVNNRQVNRSLMHPQYARRFIRSYIYNPEEGD